MLLPMEFSSRTMLEKRLAPVMELLRRQTLVEQLVDLFGRYFAHSFFGTGKALGPAFEKGLGKCLTIDIQALHLQECCQVCSASLKYLGPCTIQIHERVSQIENDALDFHGRPPCLSAGVVTSRSYLTTN